MTRPFEPDPELDALVRRLNDAARAQDDSDDVELESRPAIVTPSTSLTPVAPVAGAPHPDWVLPPATSDGREWLANLLTRARESNASDLLLVTGAAPTLRVAGKLHAISEERLSADQVTSLCAALVPRERGATLARAGAVDFSISSGAAGMFRCNVHRERGRWSAALRVFPLAPPDLDSLNLPPGLGRFAELEHGLVLVTGPTGSGKSTTMAALLRRIVAKRRVHVITIEDPVEYDHAHGSSLIEHIEIGRDAGSFAQALRAALRQNPDVLLLGEMRDRESISITITAAETGHLVISTLHTGDSPQTVSRILDTYPAGQLEAVRAQLSASLAGVVSQQLLPRIDGKGRVPAVEILWGTHGVRNLIRQGKLERLRAQISLEQAAGMLSLDQSLADLVNRKLVSLAEARVHAREPKEFEALLVRGPGH